MWEEGGEEEGRRGGRFIYIHAIFFVCFEF